jgi:hypothetical protein
VTKNSNITLWRERERERGREGERERKRGREREGEREREREGGKEREMEGGREGESNRATERKRECALGCVWRECITRIITAAWHGGAS